MGMRGWNGNEDRNEGWNGNGDKNGIRTVTVQCLFSVKCFSDRNRLMKKNWQQLIFTVYCRYTVHCHILWFSPLM